MHRPEVGPHAAPPGERTRVVNWTPLVVVAGLVLASTAYAWVKKSHQRAVAAAAAELVIESSASLSPAAQVSASPTHAVVQAPQPQPIIAAAVVSTRSMTPLSWQIGQQRGSTPCSLRSGH